MNKVFGVDISLYQKGFDFNKAKSEGVKFVIIKCSQEDFKDPQFENHYKAAKAAGLDVGAYHYTRAKTAAEAKAEAKTCISAIAGKTFEYPIFFDIEDAVHKKLTKAQNDEIIKAFCSALEAAGYWAGVYFNYDFYKNYCNGKSIADRYSLWLASWGSAAPVSCQMWQFGGETNVIRTNRVAGVVCDQNYAYKDYPSLIKSKGLNGYKKTSTQTPAQTSAPAPSASKTTLKAGNKVKVAAGAPIYGSTKLFQSWVYNSTLYLRELNGSRAVISTQSSGAVTGAVDVKYLTKA